MKTNFLLVICFFSPIVLFGQKTTTDPQQFDVQPIIKTLSESGSAPCGVFTDIACGSSKTYSTVNAGNDFVQYGGAIKNIPYNGPDLLFRLNVTTQSHLRIVLEGLTAANLDLFLLTSCETNPTVAFASTEDNRSSGIYREVIDVNSGVGVLYVIVDSKTVFDQGSFRLSVNCNCACSEPVAAQPDGNRVWGDDFEDYQPNVRLTPQSTRWQLWKSTSPASADAVVAYEGSGATQNKFAVFNGTATAQPDVVYNASNRTAGRYRLSWRMRVDAGKSGYYNVLHELPDADGQNAVHAYEVYFDNTGTGRVLVNNGGTSLITAAKFGYAVGQWANVVNLIDIEKNLVELWIGDNYVGSWPFSASSPANSPSNKQLAGIDFYAANNNTFAINNLCVWQKKTTCLTNFILAPVCTDKGDPFSNSGVARCELYTQAEYGTCTDVCDYGGAFIDRGETYSGALAANDEAPGNLKRLSATCNALTTKAALYADVYTFFNEQKKANGAKEDIVLFYNSTDPTLRCNVFLCKSASTCAPLSGSACIASVPANTNYTLDQQGSTCDNFYYIVFSGAFGATYSNFSISPNGYCPSGAEVLSLTDPTKGTIGSGAGNARFSKTGDAYKNCYNGKRSYGGMEKIYKFTIEKELPPTARLGLSIESTAPVGMFLYSYICGGTCLGYAENLTANQGNMPLNLDPGTYYLVVDRNSTAGTVSFSITPITDFIIFNLDNCNDVNSPDAHLVTVPSTAFPFAANDQVMFLSTGPDGKLEETLARNLETFDQPLLFKMTEAVSNKPKCGYGTNEPLKVFLNQKNGSSRTFRQMDLVFTPKNVAGNTAEDKFEKAKRSNIEQMTANTVSHFGTETQTLSLGAEESISRLRLSTNKRWNAVVKNRRDGTVLSNTWLKVTPNTGTGATLVRFEADPNPNNTTRSVYVEFFAEDQPRVFRHGISVFQSEKSLSAAPPGEGRTRTTELSGASLEISPNPTTGMATLQLDLPEEAEVEINLLDVLGRPVEVLQNLQTTGSRSFEVDLSGHPNGLYRVVATVDGRPIHKTLLLQR